MALHVWMSVFGSSDVAARALSATFAIATLPLIWLGGLRIGARRTRVLDYRLSLRAAARRAIHRML